MVRYEVLLSLDTYDTNAISINKLCKLNFKYFTMYLLNIVLLLCNQAAEHAVWLATYIAIRSCLPELTSLSDFGRKRINYTLQKFLKFQVHISTKIHIRTAIFSKQKYYIMTIKGLR